MKVLNIYIETGKESLSRLLEIKIKSIYDPFSLNEGYFANIIAPIVHAALFNDLRFMGGGDSEITFSITQEEE